MEEKLYIGLLDKLNYIDDLSLIKYAYETAYNLHNGQFRDSGEAYIVHPLSVAHILANMHADKSTICAAILHDTLEDTTYTLDSLENDFGAMVANLVNGVTNLPKHYFESRDEQKLYNSNKFIEYALTDVRVIIIKLADRLHNMRTIDVKSEESKINNACETMYFYVPLANYLHINYLKERLEDLSFKYLYRDIYMKLSNQRKQILLNSFFSNHIDSIKKELVDKKIQGKVKVTIKNIYGMYQDIINNKKLDLININTVVKDEVINNIDSNIKKELNLLSCGDYLQNEYGICANWFNEKSMQDIFRKIFYMINYQRLMIVIIKILILF